MKEFERGDTVKVQDKPDVVFAVEYNSCVYESSFEVVSLHRTREEADRVMELHKKTCGSGKRYEKWRIKQYQLS